MERNKHSDCSNTSNVNPAVERLESEEEDKGESRFTRSRTYSLDLYSRGKLRHCLVGPQPKYQGSSKPDNLLHSVSSKLAIISRNSERPRAVSRACSVPSSPAPRVDQPPTFSRTTSLKESSKSRESTQDKNSARRLIQNLVTIFNQTRSPTSPPTLVSRVSAMENKNKEHPAYGVSSSREIINVDLESDKIKSVDLESDTSQYGLSALSTQSRKVLDVSKDNQQPSSMSSMTLHVPDTVRDVPDTVQDVPDESELLTIEEMSNEIQSSQPVNDQGSFNEENIEALPELPIQQTDGLAIDHGPTVDPSPQSELPIQQTDSLAIDHGPTVDPSPQSELPIQQTDGLAIDHGPTVDPSPQSELPIQQTDSLAIDHGPTVDPSPQSELPIQQTDSLAIDHGPTVDPSPQSELPIQQTDSLAIDHGPTVDPSPQSELPIQQTDSLAIDHGPTVDPSPQSELPIQQTDSLAIDHGPTVDPSPQSELPIQQTDSLAIDHGPTVDPSPQSELPIQQTDSLAIDHGPTVDPSPQSELPIQQTDSLAIDHGPTVDPSPQSELPIQQTDSLAIDHGSTVDPSPQSELPIQQTDSLAIDHGPTVDPAPQSGLTLISDKEHTDRSLPHLSVIEPLLDSSSSDMEGVDKETGNRMDTELSFEDTSIETPDTKAESSNSVDSGDQATQPVVSLNPTSCSEVSTSLLDEHVYESFQSTLTQDSAVSKAITSPTNTSGSVDSDGNEPGPSNDSPRPIDNQEATKDAIGESFMGPGDSQGICCERVSTGSVSPVDSMEPVVSIEDTSNSSHNDYLNIDVNVTPSRDDTTLRVNVTPSRDDTTLRVNVTPSRDDTTLRVNVTPSRDDTTLRVNVTPSRDDTTLRVNVTPSRDDTTPRVNVTPSRDDTTLRVNVTPSRDDTTLRVNVTPSRDDTTPRDNVAPSRGDTTSRVNMAPSRDDTAPRVNLEASHEPISEGMECCDVHLNVSSNNNHPTNGDTVDNRASLNDHTQTTDNVQATDNPQTSDDAMSDFAVNSPPTFDFVNDQTTSVAAMNDQTTSDKAINVTQTLSKENTKLLSNCQVTESTVLPDRNEQNSLSVKSTEVDSEERETDKSVRSRRTSEIASNVKTRALTKKVFDMETVDDETSTSNFVPVIFLESLPPSKIIDSDATLSAYSEPEAMTADQESKNKDQWSNRAARKSKTMHKVSGSKEEKASKARKLVAKSKAASRQRSSLSHKPSDKRHIQSSHLFSLESDSDVEQQTTKRKRGTHHKDSSPPPPRKRQKKGNTHSSPAKACPPNGNLLSSILTDIPEVDICPLSAHKTTPTIGKATPTHRLPPTVHDKSRKRKLPIILEHSSSKKAKRRSHNQSTTDDKDVTKSFVSNAELKSSDKVNLRLTASRLSRLHSSSSSRHTSPTDIRSSKSPDGLKTQTFQLSHQKCHQRPRGSRKSASQKFKAREKRVGCFDKESDHHKLLMRWEKDLPLGSSAHTAPMVYALDKLQDRLATKGPWIEKAKMIWSSWRRGVKPEEKKQYLVRARENRLKARQSQLTNEAASPDPSFSQDDDSSDAPDSPVASPSTQTQTLPDHEPNSKCDTEDVFKSVDREIQGLEQTLAGLPPPVSNTPHNMYSVHSQPIPSFPIISSRTSHAHSLPVTSMRPPQIPSLPLFASLTSQTPLSMFSSPNPQTPLQIFSSPTSHTPLPVFSSSTPQTPLSVFSSPTPQTPLSVFSSPSPQTHLPMFSSPTPQTPLSVFSSPTPQTPLPMFSSPTPQTPLSVFSSPTPQTPLPMFSSPTPKTPLPVFSSPTPQSPLPVFSSLKPHTPLPMFSSLTPKAHLADVSSHPLPHVTKSFKTTLQTPISSQSSSPMRVTPVEMPYCAAQPSCIQGSTRWEGPYTIQRTPNLHSVIKSLPPKQHSSDICPKTSEKTTSTKPIMGHTLQGTRVGGCVPQVISGNQKPLVASSPTNLMPVPDKLSTLPRKPYTVEHTPQFNVDSLKYVNHLPPISHPSKTFKNISPDKPVQSSCSLVTVSTSPPHRQHNQQNKISLQPIQPTSQRSSGLASKRSVAGQKKKSFQYSITTHRPAAQESKDVLSSGTKMSVSDRGRKKNPSTLKRDSNQKKPGIRVRQGLSSKLSPQMPLASPTFVIPQLDLTTQSQNPSLSKQTSSFGFGKKSGTAKSKHFTHHYVPPSMLGMRTSTQSSPVDRSTGSETSSRRRSESVTSSMTSSRGRSLSLSPTPGFFNRFVSPRAGSQDTHHFTNSGTAESRQMNTATNEFLRQNQTSTILPKNSDSTNVSKEPIVSTADQSEELSTGFSPTKLTFNPVGLSKFYSSNQYKMSIMKKLHELNQMNRGKHRMLTHVHSRLDSINSTASEPKPVSESVSEPPKPVSESVSEPPKPVSESVSEPPKPVSEPVSEPPKPFSESAKPASSTVKGTSVSTHSTTNPIPLIVQPAVYFNGKSSKRDKPSASSDHSEGGHSKPTPRGPDLTSPLSPTLLHPIQPSLMVNATYIGDFSSMSLWEMEQLYAYNKAALYRQKQVTKTIKEQLVKMQQDEKVTQNRKLSRSDLYKRFLHFLVEPRCDSECKDIVTGKRSTNDCLEESSHSDDLPVLKKQFDIYAR